MLMTCPRVTLSVARRRTQDVSQAGKWRLNKNIQCRAKGCRERCANSGHPVNFYLSFIHRNCMSSRGVNDTVCSPLNGAGRRVRQLLSFSRMAQLYHVRLGHHYAVIFLSIPMWFLDGGDALPRVVGDGLHYP